MCSRTNTFLIEKQLERHLFSKNIHRTDFSIRDLVDLGGRIRKKLFFQIRRKLSFQDLDKIKKRFPTKVSGNCSHTFSLLFAPIFLEFLSAVPPSIKFC